MRYLKRLLLITGLLTFGSYLFWQVLVHRDKLVLHFFGKETTTIQALVLQPKNCPEVPSQIIAELCGLSCDTPSPVAAWNLYLARLAACPAIQSCSGYCKDQVGYIEYTLRQPCFFIGGFENIACDREGIGFSLTPLFSPRGLPILYSSHVATNRMIAVPKEEMAVALDVLEKIQPLQIELLHIDLRYLNHPSVYRREIILKGNRIFIRLPSQGYDIVLKNIQKLFVDRGRDFSIIDGRFENVICIQM